MSCGGFDIPTEFYSETTHRARSEQRCDACGDAIPKGHVYAKSTSLAPSAACGVRESSGSS